MLGWRLFPWQDEVVDVSGEYHPQTKIPLYRTVGVSVSRQNGKTTLVCSRIARGLIQPRATIAYTAQDRGLARTKWEEHINILMDTPFAERVDHVDRTNHREMLVMQNGSRYLPVTPSSKKAGRSLSIDLAIIDEAHAHNDMSVVSAIAPAMAAKAHAQIWLLSNAGDSASGLWRHYTDVGRLEVDNDASTMCWFEWCPENIDNDDLQFSHLAWTQANPSLGLPGGVIEQALSDGALTMDKDTFFREHLNIWMDSADILGIDAITWGGCRNDAAKVGVEVCFGLDFTPERDRGALCAAGKLVGEDGDVLTPLEVIEAGANVELLINRAAEVANTWNASIIIDRGSPAASAIPALERLTHYQDRKLKDKAHRVKVISLTELTRACGSFYDAAVHARLSHLGDYRLTDAVISATKRKAGEAWRWDRRGDAADITPLMAATLARWGVTTAPAPVAKSYSVASFG
jgi:hypothetical protein